jgi:hypothetical protein
MDPAELERIVDRALRQLPAPRAPRTLVPRVMAAARAWTERPWHARPWIVWPGVWQAASMAALVMLLAGVALLLPAVRAAAAEAASPLAARVMSETANVAMRADVTMTVARALWRALFEPVAVCALLLTFTMWTALAVFGAALEHVVSGKVLDV